VSVCPTQFQEYIAGIDYRVHVVGRDVFACRIVSTADDYRRAEMQGLSVEFAASTIPDALADLCRRAARAAGLHVAGLDFRVTADGVWYCFEMNTTPDFVGYEEVTGHSIAAAIARQLAAHERLRALGGRRTIAAGDHAIHASIAAR
jgi:glutathione synthase/RimK-type ligase-like ATP-grasp enzyme